jgi:hypothetical protein
MAEKDDVVTEPDIQVTSPDDGGTSVPAGSDVAGGSSKKAMGKPAIYVSKGKDWYRGLDKRDRLVVLIGVLAVLLALVMISIYWSGVGGSGGPDDGPVMVPISEWDRSGLDTQTLSGNEENTNLEGQNTPYLVTFTANASEVIFITHLTGHVDWTDETTPPTQLPAVGYVNEPDGFQLKIVVQDGFGEWESDLVFNVIGQAGANDITVDLEAELGAPIAVSTPEGASHLPEGYVQMLRIDFIVFTAPSVTEGTISHSIGPWTTRSIALRRSRSSAAMDGPNRNPSGLS